MLAVWVIVFAVPGAAGIGAPLVLDGGRDEPRKTAKGGKPLAVKDIYHWILVLVSPYFLYVRKRVVFKFNSQQ